MIRCRLFGPTELHTAEGVEIHQVLAQPKRLALLAYLTAAQPPGFHRRDTLLDLFWPDMDEPGARNALSKAVHHLRSALGTDALISRGEDALRLNPERFWSDVGAFDALMAKESYQEALSLHDRGGLLEGFHLSQAPAFDHWLDAERARLTKRARAAADALARRAEEAGDLHAAVAWVRRAAELSPHDEVALRRLVTLLDRCGNRAEAVAAYDAFSQRLAVDLEVQPAPETGTLIESVRRRLASRPGTDLTPVPATPHTGVTREPHVMRRRRWIGASALAALALMTGFAVLPDGGQEALEGHRVLVAAFENRTGNPSLDMLGGMAADWITQELQQLGLAQVVDAPSARLAARRVTADAPPREDFERATAMARAAGAGVVVWGALYRHRGSLLYRAQISDVREGKLLVALDPVSATAVDPLSGAARLGRRVAGALASLLDQRLASTSGRMSRPPSLDAYRQYTLGLDRFYSRPAEAAPYFEEAARLDSTFALALVWAAFAHGNSHKRDSVVRVLEARREHLSQIDGYALDYFLAYRRYDAAGMLDAARHAAQLAPGSEWNHNAALQALQQNRPRETLRLVEPIDPEHGWAREFAAYWLERTMAHHFLGEYKAELDAAREAVRLNPENVQFRGFEVRALIALGRVDEATERLDALGLLPAARNNVGQTLLAYVEEMWRHGHKEQAAEILDRAANWLRSPAAEQWISYFPSERRDAARQWIRHTTGQVAYAAGRWDEARAVYERLAADGAGGHAAWEARAYLGLLAARRGDRTAAEKAIHVLGKREPAEAISALRQAQIAALLGERERAMGFLRQMMTTAIISEGRMLFFLHRERDWDDMRGYPSFRAFMKPKG